MFRATRSSSNPIITPGSDPSLGNNINGPSLIRVPDWLPKPLGKYYLYFGHHTGRYIRLAYADHVEGPWKIHAPGTLQLDQTPCRGHIASPDVHIDEEGQRLILYYHGPPAQPDTPATQKLRVPGLEAMAIQYSYVAVSKDGLHFESGREPIALQYMRRFRGPDAWYALTMPGVLFRSEDPMGPYERGPMIYARSETGGFRHNALWRRDRELFVFYSSWGDEPESIMVGKINLEGPWQDWRPSPPETILQPEEPYEGGLLPLEASRRGACNEPVRQLRDPGIFEEEGRLWLIYSIAGEQGLALARLER